MKCNIANIRQSRGLTQRDLAKSIGRPQSYISKLESEIYGIDKISIANAVRLSKALNCNIGDLYHE